MLYILLARLTGDGQQKLLNNPDHINEVASQLNVPGTQLLARYAVLGRYDFIFLAEAEHAEGAAHLSLEFGAKAGVHIETLQAINVGLLSETSRDDILTTPSTSPEPN